MNLNEVKNKKAVKIVLLSAVLILCFLAACGKKDLDLSKTSDNVSDVTQDNTEADIDLEGDAKGSILKVSYEGNNKIVFTVMDENAASVKETEGTGSECGYYIYFLDGSGNDVSSLYITADNIAFTSAEEKEDGLDSEGMMTYIPAWAYGYTGVDDYYGTSGGLDYSDGALKAEFIGDGICDHMNDVASYRLEYRFLSDDTFKQKVIAEGNYIDILTSGEQEIQVADACFLHLSCEDGIIEGIIFGKEAVDQYKANAKEGITGISVRLTPKMDNASAGGNVREAMINIIKNEYDGFYVDNVASLTVYDHDGNPLYPSSDDKFERFPVYVGKDRIGFKITAGRVWDYLNELEEYRICRGESYYSYDDAIATGSVKDAMSGEYSLFDKEDIPKLPDLYVDSGDGNLFAPMSPFYRVWEEEYPVVLVADAFGWAYDYMRECYFYTPKDARKSSCKIVRLESIDPYGQVIQSVAKVVYPSKEDLNLACFNRGFYPIDEWGVDEQRPLDEDFYEKRMHEYLDQVLPFGSKSFESFEKPLSEYLIYETENALYFDFMPFYKDYLHYFNKETNANVVNWDEICDLQEFGSFSLGNEGITGEIERKARLELDYAGDFHRSVEYSYAFTVPGFVGEWEYDVCEVNGYSTVSYLIDKEKLKRFIDE